MSVEGKLNRLKKVELQALAVEINLPSGTEGLRSELIDRLSDYIDEHGGLNALVTGGQLSDAAMISSLGIEATMASLTTPTKSAASPSGHSAARSPPSTRGHTSTTAVTSPRHKGRTGSATASNDWFPSITEAYKVHGPPKLIKFLAAHPVGSGISDFLVDLRSRLATAESLVLIFVYAEALAFLLSQVGWSSEPALAANVPEWVARLFSVLHLPLMDGDRLALYLPQFGLWLQRKTFFYPLFYWFVYFVGIPSALGWLVNFEAVHDGHRCPVSMLTFSLSRLLIFGLMLKGGVWQLISGTAPLEMSHRSLTVLFDGNHLPLKLFLTTAVVGVVYSMHGRKK